MERGRCRVAGVPTDAFYVGSGRTAAERMATLEVKEFCHGCEVEADCLLYALDGRLDHGVWGGATEDEREAMLSRRRARAV